MNKLLWPMVVIMCVLIMTAGIHYGLKGSRQETLPVNHPQTTLPTATNEHSELLPAPPGEGYLKDSAKDDEINSKVKYQIERIEDIQEQAAEKRQEIEQHYMQQFCQLKTNADAAIRSLEAAEQAAWAGFTEKLNHTISIMQGVTATTGRVAPDGYARQVGGFFARSETRVVGNPATEYRRTKAEIAAAKNSTLSDYEQAYLRLQEQLQSELAEVERWKAQQNEYVDITIRSITSRPKSEPTGLVTAIVFSKDNPSAVVGIKVVHEGDVVNGVKVIKIENNVVHFEENGQNWTQRVQESPPDYWK